MFLRTAIIFITAFVFIIPVAFTQYNFDTSLIPEELLKGCHSVVRFDKTYVEFKSADKLIVQRERALTVFKDDHKDLLNLSLLYKKGSESIKDVTLEYYDARGNKLSSIKENKLDDYARYDGYSMISDFRSLNYDYKTIDYPVTVYYKYTKVSKNGWIPLWHPITAYKQSLHFSDYKLINESDAIIETKEFAPPNISFDKYDDLHYSMENINALYKEKYAPEDSTFPNVFFRANQFSYEGIKGTFNSWNELGKWIYEDLLAHKDMDRNELKEVVRPFISNPEDKLTTAKEIYNYIKENTRYISIGLDEGGLVPMDPKKVNELKYGDCKALSFYTHKLLGAYDIHSDYVIVEAGSDKKVSFDEDFYSVEQGNHIILRITEDQDTFWIDCTMHESPFGFLGSFTDDRSVLAVDETGGEIAKTPNYGIELNSNTTNIIIDKSDNDSYSLSYESVNKGIGYNKYKYLSRLENSDLKDFFLDQFKNIKSVSLDNSEFEFDEDSISVINKAELSFKSFYQTLGDYLLFPVGIYDLKVPYLPKDKKRVYPIQFERSFQNAYKVKIKIPESYDFVETIEDYILESDYGFYSLKISTEGEYLIYAHKFILNEGCYPAEEYKAIKHFLDTIRKKERLELTFQKKT